MSINKSQRQSQSVFGINLEIPYFSHGHVLDASQIDAMPVICHLLPCWNTNKTIYVYARKEKLRMLYIIKN